MTIYMRIPPRWVLLALVNQIHAQAFLVDDSKIPFDSPTTQDLEFGDIDLDGDWDVFLGNGLDIVPSQSALWINQGGVQGSELGLYIDETNSRLPHVEYPTFDLSLADIDGDGDVDLHVSNSSYASLLWGNRWWVNTGGKQGAAIGYFVDQTSERWIGLGMPGSSVPPLLLKSGTFMDDCRDSEFADLDNDGDLDLIHTTYMFGAPNQPARLFLNDGDGHFQEFNPPGLMTAGGTLQPGMPGVWCDGLYDNQTADTTGVECDPTTVAWDVDVGDFDADFDLDLVFADDFYDPGFFANRLEGSTLAPAAGGGSVGFRDVWGSVLGPGFGWNEDNCQELGDVDGDGDLDLAGGDYSGTGSSLDAICEWDGSAFVLQTTLSSIGQKLSADLFDFDLDGDLDYLAVGDLLQLHSNQGGFIFTEIPMPSWSPKTTWDADVGDTDGDGDLDILAATQGGEGEHLLLNQVDAPDTDPARIPRVEDVPDRTTAPAAVPVRAQVYDNAPHYITAYNPTRVELAVDGVALPPISAFSSRGQIFRAELPGNLLGQVTYRFVSRDQSGNEGSSAELAYVSTSSMPFQVLYGTATAGLAGGPPSIRALSVPFAQSMLHLAVSSNASPGTPAVIGVGTLPLNPGVHLPGLLFLQVTGQVLAVVPKSLDSGGDAVLSALLGPVPPGLTAYAQGFVLDPTGAGEVFASSKGLAITTQ